MSVSDQLLLTYDYVTRFYDLGKAVDVIFFDYRKAFDLVNHSILISKLRCIGLGDRVVDWFWDFLSGRSMRVVLSGSSSSYRDVKSGVPQGSVVGPLLFLIYINHVVEGISAKFCLFADDLKLYLAFPHDKLKFQDGCASMQRDINLLSARSSSWGLKFSASR